VLVNGVVHAFPDQMMKCRAVVHVTDVHAWSLANGLQALQNGNAVRAILFRGRRWRR
jgi:hypothetical protein